MMSDSSMPGVAIGLLGVLAFLVGRYVAAVLGPHGANGVFVR